MIIARRAGNLPARRIHFFLFHDFFLFNVRS